MVKLEDLKENSQVKGILSNQPVTILTLTWRGETAVEVVYKKTDGSVDNRLLYRNDEEKLEILKEEQKWDFSADPDAFKLAAEAYRIHLAHLFDPVLAVHTSLIEPLPHQIIAVYEQMLPRQPLRFLLADDPGAGKTIMAGLLIKELIIRGDVERSLICVPGNLAAQWQDELWFKFQLRYEIITRESFESSVVGNPFLEHDNVIIRLDHISRNDDYREKLSAVDWDIVVVDEAHKMSAHFWSGELEETKRFKLGKLLRAHTRHLLLMTATPHSGIEEDFQIFLSLLDQDRFEGRFREGVHEVEISDLMRRMVKEDLRRFDGRPLFPERKAFTIDYPLPPQEAELYELVTAYVREEFNRAEALLDGRRKGSVGFALTILQRRLASSPAAIYHSLRRRRERLEKRLDHFENQIVYHFNFDFRDLEDDDRYAYDEDYPAEELEEIEEAVVDSATASQTIDELKAEIDTLQDLEDRAFNLLKSGQDRKWDELSRILQDDEHMVSSDDQRRKLVIFTEHRDTLNYLKTRIMTLFGRDEMIVHIDGSVPRDERRRVENEFRNNPDVYFLLGTDAAGEGINLQQAHLMVNYDLPWNPNRLEQRFGRIHRIGQTEVCFMWNLVAGETREGYVYKRLLRKLETENQALNGKVFDVLGEALQKESLSKLLIQAVRYGDSPEVKKR
jgi:SNF2 family DNA or RNA helicase